MARGKIVNAIILVSIIAAVLVLALLSLKIGAINISIKELAALLANRGGELTGNIVIQFRLPHLLAVIMAGAVLGVAGALMQHTLRNPMASPDVLGMTGAASASVAFWMTFAFESSIFLPPLIGSAGALTAGTLLYGLYKRINITRMRLAFIGIGLSIAMYVLTSLLMKDAPSYLAAQLAIGGIHQWSWDYIDIIWPWVVLLLLVAILLFGNSAVQHPGETGVKIEGRWRSLGQSQWVNLLICSLLCGIAVSLAGAIAFIGLLAPILARLAGGVTGRFMLPLSALLGAGILLFADLAARSVYMPVELPSGIFTAAMGIPLFLYFLFKTWRSGKVFS